MIEVKAKLKYSRMSPRKTRLLVDVVRGLPVIKAESQLKLRRLKAAPIVLKLLKSAIANAEHNHKLEKSNLYIKKISVDGGPVLKRFTPKAFGRAGSIRKPTSHIEIVLAEIKPSKKVESKSKVIKDIKSEDKKQTDKETDKNKKEVKSDKKIVINKKSKNIKNNKETKEKK